MKKIISLILVFIFCSPLSSAVASINSIKTTLPSQEHQKINTESSAVACFLDPKRFNIGVDYENIFKRELKAEPWSKDQILLVPNTINYLYPQAIMEDPEINSLYRVTLKTNYTLFSNLNIFVKLGIADIKIKEQAYRGVMSTTDPMRIPWTVDVVNIGGVRDYKINNGFVYGGGFKLNQDLSYGWILGINMQYLKHKHDYVATNYSLATGGPIGGQIIMGDEAWDGILIIQEWQIALSITKKIGNFSPYLGVKYSDLRIRDESQIGVKYFNTNGIRFIDLSTTGYIQKYKAKHNVGPFIGLDFNIGKHIKLNIEGRFVDETAMSFNATYKF